MRFLYCFCPSPGRSDYSPRCTPGFTVVVLFLTVLFLLYLPLWALACVLALCVIFWPCICGVVFADACGAIPPIMEGEVARKSVESRRPSIPS